MGNAVKATRTTAGPVNVESEKRPESGKRLGRASTFGRSFAMAQTLKQSKHLHGANGMRLTPRAARMLGVTDAKDLRKGRVRNTTVAYSDDMWASYGRRTGSVRGPPAAEKGASGNGAGALALRRPRSKTGAVKVAPKDTASARKSTKSATKKATEATKKKNAIMTKKKKTTKETTKKTTTKKTTTKKTTKKTKTKKTTKKTKTKKTTKKTTTKKKSSPKPSTPKKKTTKATSEKAKSKKKGRTQTTWSKRKGSSTKSMKGTTPRSSTKRRKRKRSPSSSSGDGGGGGSPAKKRKKGEEEIVPIPFVNGAPPVSELLKHLLDCEGIPFECLVFFGVFMARYVDDCPVRRHFQEINLIPDVGAFIAESKRQGIRANVFKDVCSKRRSRKAQEQEKMTAWELLFDYYQTCLAIDLPYKIAAEHGLRGLFWKGEGIRLRQREFIGVSGEAHHIPDDALERLERVFPSIMTTSTGMSGVIATGACYFINERCDNNKCFLKFSWKYNCNNDKELIRMTCRRSAIVVSTGDQLFAKYGIKPRGGAKYQGLSCMCPDVQFHNKRAARPAPRRRKAPVKRRTPGQRSSKRVRQATRKSQ